MTTLVMGATGAIGRWLVEYLLDAGAPVRALTRDARKPSGLPAAAELVEGDYRRPAGLAAALKGVDQVYLQTDPDVAGEVTATLHEAGVRHIVSIVSTVLDRTDSDGNVSNPIEDAVRTSGAEWTILRPRAFATNAVNWWSGSIRAQRAVHWVYPQAQLSPIHEADVAAVAAAALTQDGHAGESYTLTGPAALSQAEQVRLIGAALGEEVRFHEITPEEAQSALTAHHVPEHIVGLLMGMLKAHVGTPAPVTDEVQRLTSRPGRSFAQWAEDHVGDFR